MTATLPAVPADLLEAGGLRVSRDGDVVRVVLSRPENRNAQTPATWRALAAIGDSLPSDVRVVRLCAEGRSFSAGLDRRMFTPEGIPGETSLIGLAAKDDAGLDATIAEAQRAFTWWREVDALTVAVVQGHAVGAGFQLALACDLMVVAEDVQLSMRETQLGLVPDLGGTHRLVAAVGYSRALEICATGRWIGVEEARALGIAVASAPVERLEPAVTEFLDPFLGASRGSVVAIKHLLDGADHRTAEQQRERERQFQAARLRALSMGRTD